MEQALKVIIISDYDFDVTETKRKP